MSPNPWSLVEGLVAACVGVLWKIKFVIHLLFESKTDLNQKLFWKIFFSKEVEKQPVVFLVQSVVGHVVVFEKGLKLFDLVDCCQTNSIGCFENSTDCFFKNP